jgi:hypothetical protein
MKCMNVSNCMEGVKWKIIVIFFGYMVP